MPRKQNGFGNSKSFAAKGVNSRIDVGKVKGAGGTYPSNRRFGSSVHRTAQSNNMTSIVIGSNGVRDLSFTIKLLGTA